VGDQEVMRLNSGDAMKSRRSSIYNYKGACSRAGAYIVPCGLCALEVCRTC